MRLGETGWGNGGNSRARLRRLCQNQDFQDLRDSQDFASPNSRFSPQLGIPPRRTGATEAGVEIIEGPGSRRDPDENLPEWMVYLEG